MDLEQEERERESHASKDINPGKIDTGLRYHEWNLGFKNFLSARMGIQGKLDYVIQKDKPSGWDIKTDAVNDNERCIYRTHLTGNDYQADNASIWQLIKEAVLKIDVWMHVKTFDSVQNGRGAIATLGSYYEGEGKSTKQRTLVQTELKTSHYRNEYAFPFAKFATKLKRAYTVLEAHSYAFTDSKKVETLYEKLQVTNLQWFKIAKSSMLDNHRNNFEQAVTYKSQKVTEIFSEAILDSNTIRGSNATSMK
eukprot:3027033-Ditylum_brightwellii.AAC.1